MSKELLGVSVVAIALRRLGTFACCLSVFAVSSIPVLLQAQEASEAGVITIESDLQSADNSTGVITASGNVRLVHPDRGVVATSQQAQYFTQEERIVLSGDVDVVQDEGNRLQAAKVIYLLDEERALAMPADGEQVFSQWTLDQSDLEPSSLTP